MDHSKPVAVIGGGISGLCCAYRLRQLGVPVTLFEASAHGGGLMQTAEKDGFLFESGPQSFQTTPLLTQLFQELSLEVELCKADSRAPRYILRGGRMQKIAMSPQALLSSSLLSPMSRWKIASEPFRRTRPLNEEESVASFVRRKFGQEILEYLVSPFVSGVYAGDPEKLSLRAAFPSLDEWEREFGSVLRGAMKSRKQSPHPPASMCSFRQGTATLPRALAAALGANFKTGSRVARISARAPHFELRLDENAAPSAPPMDAAAVVLATPAYVASHIVRSLNDRTADTLSGIAYAPVAVYTAGYRAKQADAPPHGFGVLIPRSEKYRTLGIIWNSSLFPSRAAEGTFAITSFLGGATDPAILDLSDTAIAAIAEKDSSVILGLTGPPASAALWRHPRALPQYNLGHGHIVESLRASERSVPGLFFAGNYLEGPSVGACVENGFKTAEAVRAHLQL